MKASTFLALAFACTTSTAALATGWGVQTTVTGLFIDPATGIVRLKTTNNQSIDSCQNTVYLQIASNDAHLKELYATLMSAHLAGSTVSLYYDGCLGAYPKISTVAVPNIW